MQPKNLFYSFMLCLVFMVASACSPAAGPDDDRQQYKSMGNRVYNNPSGMYDDDRGYKNDFQMSDLNPNMVTGQNDLQNRDSDAKLMAEIASTVRGVDHAAVNINGGTAHVNVNLAQNTDRESVRKAVHDVVKQKMPRYNVDVDVNR